MSFIIQHFHLRKKKQIVQNNTKPENNPEIPQLDFSQQKETVDNIFVLSASEAEKYLPSYTQLPCRLTAYANSKNNYFDRDDCHWWLRTPSFASITYVLTLSSKYGSIEYKDGANPESRYAVRPAMWLKIN